MTAPVAPLPLGDPLDYADAREGLRDLARRRRAARAQRERAHADLAEAEREYRKAKAQAYVVVKASETEGQKLTAGERDTRVEEATADLHFARNIAQGMLKSAEELLDEVDAERASLHRLMDWSMKEPAGNEAPNAIAQARDRLRDRIPPREAA